MGILQDQINTEQLSIRDVYTIRLDNEWKALMPGVERQVFVDYLWHLLEDEYNDQDPCSQSIYAEILNDIPRFAIPLIVDTSYHTSYEREMLSESARRTPVFWGVPEVPAMVTGWQFSVRCGPSQERRILSIDVINELWERSYRGVNPIVYDKFIRYMHRVWQTSIPFCKNPNPWRTLQQMINKYGNTD